MRQFFSATIRRRAAAFWAAGLCLALAASALTFGLVGGTVKAALPADNIHLGVASCGGTTCHGRQEADGKIVRQDEILRWQEPSSPTGAHSRAYAVLSAPRGAQLLRGSVSDPQLRQANASAVTQMHLPWANAVRNFA
ncbi:hypothetical protein [Sphingomonas paeninsulae]|uniref:hypothetical protein n=1 Tax=Sphingomonas paeninsulae TaxID=2319844 RepID=UPI002681779F